MKKVKEIMSKDVVTIEGTATIADCISLMKEKGLRALLVDRRGEEDAYGLITETDIVYKVVAFGKDPKKIQVHEVMSKPCVVVNPDLGVEYLARLFANFGIRRAPVIQKELIGFVSVTDIIRKGT